MAQFQHLCMGCMQPTEPGETVCPHCSYNSLSPQHSPYLPKQTVLSGRYLVGKVISISTDSVTYIGLDLQTQKVISIVEFLPEKIITRAYNSSNVDVKISSESLFNSCMKDFVSLWRAIMSISDCFALPNVRDVFFCNSTAYAVYDHFECVTLKEYIRTSGKILSWNTACNAFKNILLALSKLHSLGIIHAAVSPSTILVDSEGKLRLGGFSIPQTKSDTFELSSRPASGYAPIELSDSRIRIGAFSDVYSIAAVMYFAVTGIEPQDAVDRTVSDNMMIPVEIARTIPPDAIDALVSSLQIYPHRRIRTIDQLISALYEGGMDMIKKQIQKLTSEPSEPTVIKSAPIPDEDFEKGRVEDIEKEEPDKSEKSSSGILALKVFLSATVIIAMLFCTLYSTVLYKKMDIPFLNKAFSAFSFLPVNSNENPTHKSEQTSETSTEPEYVTVADFMSLTYSDIINNRTFNNALDITYQFSASDTVEKNSIISQSIAAGEKVAKGAQITLVISTGKPVKALLDVIGMQYDDAFRLLDYDGFKVKKVLLENDGAQTPGEVFTMSHVAGLEFEVGTTITLSVWDEPKNVE